MTEEAQGESRAVTETSHRPRLDPESEFRKVFESEFGYVWKCLQRLGVAPADLEDVTHEVFVALYRKRREYDPARPLRPFLFGFAMRAASDHRRKPHHRRERFGEETEKPDSAPDAERRTASREARSLVLAALGTMTEDRRAVFVMHEIDEFSMPEIVEALGIPLNTGYSRLRLARAEFAEAVRELSAGDHGGGA